MQVRTALQDAWAIISHHLVYKRESAIPPPLRRKINSLAGLLETADDQFEYIRQLRNEYIKGVEAVASQPAALLAVNANVDSITVFLRQRFPKDELTFFPGQAQVVLADFDSTRYSTIGDLEDMFQRTAKASEQYFKRTRSPNCSFTRLAVALSLDDRRYRRTGWDEADVALFDELEELVEPRHA